MRLKVELINGVDRQSIEGFIVKFARNHTDDFFNLWLNQLRATEAEDKFWDWLFKLGMIDRNEEYEGYGFGLWLLNELVPEHYAIKLAHVYLPNKWIIFTNSLDV